MPAPGRRSTTARYARHVADSLSPGAARSFGSEADRYDRFRPGPPDEALDWLVGEHCGAALDVGAGTGAMSRRLAERAGRVVAVEPDARMLAVLHRRSPAAGAVVGAAEHLPLASGQFDVVVVSSAWHWMEPAAASMEIARVLRPGGVFGVLWSGADRSVDWVGEDLAAPAGTPVRHHRRTVDLPPGAPFERPELASLQWTLPRTGPELLGLAGTYSSVLIRTPAEQRAARSRVEGAIDSIMQGADDGVRELPMRARCWRAVRT